MRTVGVLDRNVYTFLFEYMYHNGQLVIPRMGSGNKESDGNLLQPYTDSPNTSSGKQLHITI